VGPPRHGALLIAVAGQYSPLIREEARARRLHLWTLEEVDYLIMAADLESNAPLAYLGLEVGVSNYSLTPRPHWSRPLRGSGSFSCWGGGSLSHRWREASRPALVLLVP